MLLPLSGSCSRSCTTLGEDDVCFPTAAHVGAADIHDGDGDGDGDADGIGVRSEIVMAMGICIAVAVLFFSC